MPIQITSTTSLKHTVVGGVLDEWKALVQRESQTAYRLTGVEADHIALLSSPVVSVSVGLRERESNMSLLIEHVL